MGNDKGQWEQLKGKDLDRANHSVNEDTLLI